MKTVLNVFAVLLTVVVFRSVASDDEPYDKFLKATRQFAVQLLKNACQDGKNAIMSPASVSAMLALLQQAARGNTAHEFSHVLGMDPEISGIGHRNLTKSFSERSRGAKLEWGNKVYTKPGLNVNAAFRDDVEENFGTDIEEMNFTREPAQVVADQINKWISESTHDQIKDMIEPGMVNADTILLLVNVIYFKGNWRNRFREKNTKTEKFELSSSESVSAPFMFQKNKFSAGRNITLGVKWVEIPFEGETHKMLFVLPLKRHTLNKVMSRLTGEDLQNMIQYGDLTEVRLRIPKFKLSEKLSLVEILSEMGIREVFTGSSNLSGFSPEPLQVSEALHQANIEIDEKGSTASAATVVTVSRKLVLSETFRFDQPFLFFVIDARNQVPLFAGKIADPTKAS